MEYNKKAFEELDVLDDFLMNAIASNKEVGIPFCRRILSVLLQREIGEIRVTAQSTIPGSFLGMRGIRMDVEIEEAGNEKKSSIANVYDLEPHLRKDIHIPKHNRFYQAKIDSRYLKSGEKDFSKLPNLYVITITNFDPFGYDYMMYTIKNSCIEEPELKYDDGLQFVYFNTQGTKGGSKEIKSMLQYIQNSTEDNVTNEATREVHNYVKKVKVLPEVKQGYMKLEEIIAYAKQDGWEEGRQSGIQEGIEQGMQQSVLELLEELGDIPTKMKEKIEHQKDTAVLKQWCKLAAKVDTIEEFAEQMDIAFV